jgi:hypothetical protein
VPGTCAVSMRDQGITYCSARRAQLVPILEHQVVARTSAGIPPLQIGREPLFLDRRAQIVELAVRHALPTIYYSRQFTESGGLMSYATDGLVQFRQAGLYAGCIPKGEKPADMLVMQATKFELVRPRGRSARPCRPCCSASRTKSSNRRAIGCGAGVSCWPTTSLTAMQHYTRSWGHS